MGQNLAQIENNAKKSNNEEKYIDDKIKHRDDCKKIELTYFYGENKYEFKVRSSPFGDGFFKKAYEAVFISQNRTTKDSPEYDSKCYVIKIKKKGPILKRDAWNQDLLELCKLAKYVEAWNALGITDKTYRASEGSVLKVADGNGVFQKGEYVLIEKILSSFEKWNWPMYAEKGARSLSIQAFGHWTYHISNGKELVNDAQGMRTDTEYVITDPYYLNSDEHQHAINEWFHDHKCNKFCQKNWRTPKYVDVDILTPRSHNYDIKDCKSKHVKPTDFSNV